jgi:Transglycosylase-like domain
VAVPVAQGRPAEHNSNLADAAVQRTYLNLYEKAKDRGARPGKNIHRHGVAAHGGLVRSPTKAELRRSIRVLKRMTSSPAASTAGSTAAGGAANPQLEAIAACESGGDPTAVGGGGLYRGKYQFTYETWQSVGGTGDPAAAPEAEQDRRAAMLLARSGTGQWPVCGG